MAFVGDPPLFRPEADEVHVSVTFTWDMEEAVRLLQAWSQYYPTVRIGGPACVGVAGRFVPGKYVKEGVTFTTRGCNRRCPWCLVPTTEGRLTLRDFEPGWIIQDNNLLQAPRDHIEAVLDMLAEQPKAAVFAGGLQANLVSEWFARRLQAMRVGQVFLAADTFGALKPLRSAVDRLAFLGRRKLRCYVLIGFKGETVAEAEARLEVAWDIGVMPFAQLYQPPDGFIQYPRVWKSLARLWSRPAAMQAMHKEGVL
tara:strand:- start:1207 stop:1971 length:765 start_codon:yes stop_codon:yes gene_type:complete